MTGAVARRYAKALFALAKQDSTLEQTAEQLQRMAALADDPAVGSWPRPWHAISPCPTC
jgi:F0F1-type ATP synthase delta subunit